MSDKIMDDQKQIRTSEIRQMSLLCFFYQNPKENYRVLNFTISSEPQINDAIFWLNVF